MEEDLIKLGLRDIWGGEEPFFLADADRRQHLLACGATGSGKTTLLKSMIVADFLTGKSLVVIDPHGDLTQELLDHFPPRRTSDLIYIEPTAAAFPVGFNPLHNVAPDRSHLVVDSIVAALKNIWGTESWGPRLQYLLTNTLAALCECQNVSLLSVGRTLLDGAYRNWVIGQIRNQSVRQFWTQEYSSWDARFRAEAAAPVLNKVSALTLATPMRNVLGQVRSAFEPRWAMDHGKVVLVNLSRGQLGTENAALLGSLLVASFGLAALGRADVQPSARRSTTIYIDEFPTVTGDALAFMLAENRKYNVSMVLACQSLSAVKPGVLDAILANVATTIAFRVGEKDAQVLSRQFASAYHPDAFTSLENYRILAKMLRHEPFSGRTLPSDHPVFGRREQLLRYSRERYGTPRNVVEDKIDRWMREWG